MNNIIFDRLKHVFHSEAFSEIIKDTIRFFNGTPVHLLPPPENFLGAGVYALYYIGKHPYYKQLYEQNRTSFSQAVYVGKAVPRGWRQARSQGTSNELYTRLNEHYKSISAAKNLDIEDFRCRFIMRDITAKREKKRKEQRFNKYDFCRHKKLKLRKIIMRNLNIMDGFIKNLTINNLFYKRMAFYDKNKA